MDPRRKPLVIVVGSGGVGKTTLAAAMGVRAAQRGDHTLVMTFDPSLRLKDALGVGDEARDAETEVPAGGEGKLWASLLDARRTFDRLIERYAPDEAARQRILTNRFYDQLSGNLAGVLEYMASERLVRGGVVREPTPESSSTPRRPARPSTFSGPPSASSAFSTAAPCGSRSNRGSTPTAGSR